MNENGGNSDILSSIRVGLGHSERGFHSAGYCELVRKVTLIRIKSLTRCHLWPLSRACYSIK